MDDNHLHHGAAAALELASAANGFIEERAPWTQAKDPALSEDLDDTLGSLARALAGVAALLHPFLPAKMEEVIRRLGLAAVPLLDEIATLELGGNRVTRGDVLFPRPLS
jgi:methionyl-tRNA synthetase